VKVHRFPTRSGPYEVSAAPILDVAPVSQAMVGLCYFGEGRRSPESGMRISGATELGYVVRGRLRIDTADAQFEVRAGDVLTSSPTEPHCTTALEDSEIFFVLLDPV